MNALRAALVVLVLLPALIGAAAEQRTRRVFVSVADNKGAPVIDLTAADFAVKEDGKPRDISRVALATQPMQIAILVDDNGTGIFRYGVSKFVESLLGRTEFSIRTVTGQMLRLVDYTANPQPLSEAIMLLNARPATNDGGQLLDGISETAQELDKREAARPVIVALTVGGQEHSTLPAHHVLDKLRQSGAALYVIQVVNNTLRSQPGAPTAGSLLEENMNLGEVLGDGPKQSGGRREEIIAATGLGAGLQGLADLLKHQYVIEYTLPEGARPSEKLNISVKRRGVTLRAPTRIPNR